MASSNLLRTAGGNVPFEAIDGFKFFDSVFSAEVVRSALAYRPADEDIFLVTYPKCGSTWAFHVMTLILRHGEKFRFSDNRSVWGIEFLLELVGPSSMETIQRPFALRTHLSRHMVPWSDSAKYIYVTRNPKDACVSFFYFIQNMFGYAGTFDQFFEHFMTGDLPYGDYFDHLLGWNQQRHDPNVLFVTYEEMKENPEAVIFKMASFIDDEKFAEPLRKDRQKLENVLKYSSFGKMKAKVNGGIDRFFSTTSEAETSRMAELKKNVLPKFYNPQIVNITDRPKPSNFVRKGIIGDWRNHFSEEQSRRMDKKFAEKTKDVDIAKHWGKYM